MDFKCCAAKEELEVVTSLFPDHESQGLIALRYSDLAVNPLVVSSLPFLSL